MFSEIFQHQENKVKECGLKTLNEVRSSNFLAGMGMEGGEGVGRRGWAPNF